MPSKGAYTEANNQLPVPLGPLSAVMASMGTHANGLISLIHLAFSANGVHVLHKTYF